MRAAPAPSGVLILTGQTASGKSTLAIELAQRFGAEIVGADSRQIYRGMPIGTAAPSDGELARVRHHLIGFLDPHERYSAARFVADALAAIDEIHARGKRAIVAGGTGFYLRALTGDVALSPVHDEALRERLAREARIHPPEVLAGWLRALDPRRASEIATNDPYRLTRALEIALGERASRGADATALAATVQVGKAGARRDPLSRTSLRHRNIPYRKVALDVSVALLETRVAARVDAMLAAGFVAEAERVGPDAVAADAVGYREASAYLNGWSTMQELRTHLIRNTRRYAKRQATWFRTEPDLERIAVADGLETGLPEVIRTLGWMPATND